MKEYYSKCYDLKLPDNKNRVLRKCRLVQFQGVQFLDIQSEPFWDYQEGPHQSKMVKENFNTQCRNQLVMINSIQQTKKIV